MRAEEGGLLGDLPGDRQAARLVADGEAVAALHLDGRGALAAHLVDEAAEVRRELLVGGGAGGGDGGADAAGGVRRPGHPRRELLGAVPGEDEVAVRVDEPRDDRPTAEVVRRVGGGRLAPAGPTHATRPPSITSAASCSTPSSSSCVDSSPIPVSATEVMAATYGSPGRARHRRRPGRRVTSTPSRRTRVTSAPDAAKTAVPASAPVPAVRTLAVSRVTRSARAPTAIRPASSNPSDACPSCVAAREQLVGRPVPALLGGQPLVELDGPHLLEQVDDRVAVRARA